MKRPVPPPASVLFLLCVASLVIPAASAQDHGRGEDGGYNAGVCDFAENEENALQTLIAQRGGRKGDQLAANGQPESRTYTLRRPGLRLDYWVTADKRTLVEEADMTGPYLLKRNITAATLSSQLHLARSLPAELTLACDGIDLRVLSSGGVPRAVRLHFFVD